MKKLLKVLPVVLVLILCLTTNVFASSDGISTSFPSGGSEITQVSNAAKKVWATLKTIVQMCAFAGIILAGIRYMLADSKEKSDIKGQTIVLVFGAALVFAAPAIISFIQSVATTLFGQN